MDKPALSDDDKQLLRRTKAEKTARAIGVGARCARGVPGPSRRRLSKIRRAVDLWCEKGRNVRALRKQALVRAHQASAAFRWSGVNTKAVDIRGLSRQRGT